MEFRSERVVSQVITTSICAWDTTFIGCVFTKSSNISAWNCTFIGCKFQMEFSVNGIWNSSFL